MVGVMHCGGLFCVQEMGEKGKRRHRNARRQEIQLPSELICTSIPSYIKQRVEIVGDIRNCLAFPSANNPHLRPEEAEAYCREDGHV